MRLASAGVTLGKSIHVADESKVGARCHWSESMTSAFHGSEADVRERQLMADKSLTSP